jgi:hypothetical protein
LDPKVKIEEQYLDYSPPVEVHRSIQLLLRHVPEEYLKGLHKIILTNSASLRSAYRGKFWAEKRRIRPADCQGLYREGHILLVVDQILREYPEVILLVPPIKTFAIAEVLYHEVGHHIHRNEQPGYRDNKEVVADEWKEKLLQTFMLQRYWYLAKLVRTYARLVHPILLKLLRRTKGNNVECDAGPA